MDVDLTMDQNWCLICGQPQLDCKGHSEHWELVRDALIDWGVSEQVRWNVLEVLHNDGFWTTNQFVTRLHNWAGRELVRIDRAASFKLDWVHPELRPIQPSP